MRHMSLVSTSDRVSDALAVLFNALRDAGGPRPGHEPDGGTRRRAVPFWDKDRHELRLGRIIVKRFRRPAGNQELILSALQELGWPPCMDDPLPPRPGLNGKQRLHDTINRLNRCQESKLIRFHGNGSGTGIAWDLVR